MNAPRITVWSPNARRSPRETDAGLEIPASVEAVVESATGPVLAGEVDVAGINVVVRLLIVCFHPGGVRIVTQAEIQG